MALCLVLTIFPLVRAVKLRRMEKDAFLSGRSPAGKLDEIYRKSIELEDASRTSRDARHGHTASINDSIASGSGSLYSNQSGGYQPSSASNDPSGGRSTTSSRPISSVHTVAAWSSVSASATLAHVSDHDSETQSLPRYTQRHSKGTDDEIQPC